MGEDEKPRVWSVGIMRPRGSGKGPLDTSGLRRKAPEGEPPVEQPPGDAGPEPPKEPRHEMVASLRAALAKEQAELRRLEALTRVLPWERGPERSPQVAMRRGYIAIIEESIRDAEAGRMTRFEKNAMASEMRRAMSPGIYRYVLRPSSHYPLPATSVTGPDDPRTRVMLWDCPEPAGPMQ